MARGYLQADGDPSNNFIEVVLRHAIEMAKQVPQAFRIEARRRTRRGGGTLRPGSERHAGTNFADSCGRISEHTATRPI